MTSRTNKEPSLSNPTEEYLNENFKKTDLQKMCIDMGITKIWINKNELIRKILEKLRPAARANSTNEDLGDSSNPHSPADLTSEVSDIKEELRSKTKQIEELNELLKSANVMINKLSDRITALEEKVEHQDLENQGDFSQRDQEEENRTLLLGDTNLLNVKASDLGRRCLVRTIKGGNCDLISSWVTEKLNWKPSNCVLVCGTHDILEGETPGNILDSLGSLIAQLKQVNENMVINICQISPTLRTDEFEETIIYLNEQLEEWCNKNGVILVKSFLTFKLGTGEVDKICYNTGGENSGVFLSRFGVIRLLSTIEKFCAQFRLREDWNEIRLLNEGNHAKITVNRSSPIVKERHRNIILQRNMGRNMGTRRRSYNYRNFEGDRYHLRRERNSISSNILQSNNDAIETVRHVFNKGKGRGCFNCGELNHRENTCRFDHRLRCGSCEGLGHKSRHCHYFNQ